MRARTPADPGTSSDFFHHPDKADGEEVGGVEIEEIEHLCIPASVPAGWNYLVRKLRKEAEQSRRPRDIDLLARREIGFRMVCPAWVDTDAEEPAFGFKHSVNRGESAANNRFVTPDERQNALRENVCKDATGLRADILPCIDDGGRDAARPDSVRQRRRIVRAEHVIAALEQNCGKLSGRRADFENGTRPKPSGKHTQELLVAKPMSFGDSDPLPHRFLREVVF